MQNSPSRETRSIVIRGMAGAPSYATRDVVRGQDVSEEDAETIEGGRVLAI
jgi:hypothetical protein